MFTEQSDNRKKQEVTTLARWLVSIPSVTGTKGEHIIMDAILNGISDFGYFKSHPDNLIVVRHEDQINTSVIAMVMAGQRTPDTTIMLCSPDTSGVDNYGVLKPYAFKCDDLPRKLATLDPDERLYDDLSSVDDWLFGLGVYESKTACAAFLVSLKNYSDRPELLRHNLLFVCTSSTIHENRGTRALLPYLDELARVHNLKYRLAVNIRPSLSDDDGYHVYSRSVGHICPCFYVVGKSDQRNPFRNFSSILLTSKLIEELELNPALTGSISRFHSCPVLESLHARYSADHHPHEVLLKFKLSFFNLDPGDLIDVLKLSCVEAFNKTAALLDDREARYCRLNGSDFDPELIDAEVVTYAELTARAARSYPGDLSAAIDTMVARADEDGLDTPDILCRILDRLIELARLARPSVIIFLADDFIPQQNLFEQIPQERETILQIGGILERLSQRKGYAITLEEQPYTAQDISFLRPTAADSAIETLAAQCPFRTSPFYNLHVPIFTLGIGGRDLNLPGERVHKDTFVFLIDVIDMILSQEAAAGAGGSETASGRTPQAGEGEGGSAAQQPLPAGNDERAGRSEGRAYARVRSALNDHLFRRSQGSARGRETAERASSDR